MIIVSVLRSGGEYTPAHAFRLYEQLKRTTPAASFNLMTDIVHAYPPDMGVIPLKKGYAGWWAKMEALALDGPVMYLDLDTTIICDLSPLAHHLLAPRMIALRDFNYPARLVQSSVMAWGAGCKTPARIAAAFEKYPPQRAIDEYTTSRWLGDQGFIERHAAAELVFWQDIAPGAFVSYKRHCASGIPADARAVIFHGRPRPWEVKEADNVEI